MRLTFQSVGSVKQIVLPSVGGQCETGNVCIYDAYSASCFPGEF